MNGAIVESMPTIPERAALVDAGNRKTIFNVERLRQ